ncbi:nucleotidyltransferase substrate binding protein [Desulfonatronum thioautotrophicum]|uniref:nucleotidyltransferase substrate binding protein n=1 Tax=Desulfonatronum thioautotrophicum TaxID=617001 RepID=UPI0005EBEA8F|nr:nucleotidyltransferase substrate binding protein [Desulfonatronum thioautotrophicum]
MDSFKQIRWEQRFTNYQHALRLLTEAVERIDDLDDLGKEGLVQRFEYTFELAWKTIKDFLNAKGVDVRFPRDVIKRAFSDGIIDDGEAWLDMLDQRNRLAHTYNEADFRHSVEAIVTVYFDQLVQLQRYFEREHLRSV